MKHKTAGRPGKTVMAFIDPDVRDALDVYLESDELGPTLTAVLEVAIKEFLAKRSAWPAAQVPQPKRPGRPPKRPLAGPDDGS